MPIDALVYVNFHKKSRLKEVTCFVQMFLLHSSCMTDACLNPQTPCFLWGLALPKKPAIGS